MIYSVLYVVLITSLVNGLPDSTFEKLSNFNNLILSSSNTQNEIKNARKDEILDDPVRRVIDESHNDVQVVNPGEPMSVGDLIDKFKNEAEKKISEGEKKEIVGILQQLRKAVHDDSTRRVNVLYKGIWHAVDLGIVGSSQRKRDAKKADGVFESIKQLYRAFTKMVWGWFGYTDDEEKKKVNLIMTTDYDEKDDNNDDDGYDDDHKNGKKADKGKDKDKNEDISKDGIDKSKKVGGDENTTPLVKDEKSDDSSDKVEIVLKPLAVSKDLGPNAHPGFNGKLSFDTKWQDRIGDASKSLAGSSKILGDKLTSREEVDKELIEAEDRKDFNNRFFERLLNSRKVMNEENDKREWTEANALERLDEMNKDFEKTTDKTQMKKDILSLSMQPLFYVETYDKIMDMIDRLQENGVPGNDLRTARNLLFEQQLFSLQHSIQQTPKKKYRAERRKKIEYVTKKENDMNKDNREWTEDKVLDRIEEIYKNFDKAAADKEKILKDLASICMQPPSYRFETYNKIHELIDKLKVNKIVTTDELEIAEDALFENLKFLYFDAVLQGSEQQEHQKFKLQAEKVEGKKGSHKDTREFAETQALTKIDDMGSLAEKLYNWKQQYIKPGVPLNAEQKRSLFNDLQILRKEESFPTQEFDDAVSLVKAVMGDDEATDPAQVHDLYHFVVRNQKNPVRQVDKSSAEFAQYNFPLSNKGNSDAVIKTRNLTSVNINPDDFKVGKVVNGVASAL